MMYHGALLTRVKKMPPFDAFKSGKKAMQGIDEAAIIAGFRALGKKNVDSS